MIDQIQALCDQAAPGPWLYEEGEVYRIVGAGEGWKIPTTREELEEFCTLESAFFVAHARQLMPLLLAVARDNFDYWDLIAAPGALEDKVDDLLLLPERMKNNRAALEAYYAEYLEKGAA